jgi:hypothetical protein
MGLILYFTCSFTYTFSHITEACRKCSNVPSYISGELTDASAHFTTLKVGNAAFWVMHTTWNCLTRPDFGLECDSSDVGSKASQWCGAAHTMCTEAHV